MPENAPVPLNRIERVLAAMIAAVVGVSVISIAATLIASSAGADMTAGLWPAAAMIGCFGLPIAFVLIVVFLILSVVRRNRLARDGGR